MRQSTVVSYEDILRGKGYAFRSIQRWDDCVEKASAIFEKVKTSRQAIAELALRACYIRHGGRLSAEELKSSLTQFAKDCGIHVKTLGHWIAIKRHVLDELPPETEVNWSAAEFAYRFMAVPTRKKRGANATSQSTNEVKITAIQAYKKTGTKEGRIAIRSRAYIVYCTAVSCRP